MAIESTLKNLVLTLVVVTIASALGLGGMNVVTQEPIQQTKQAKVAEALKEVLPPYDNDPAAEMSVVETDGMPVKVYKATKDGQFVGGAVESFSAKGFSGMITVMYGFDKEGKITGYSVLSQAETPGLGTKMVDWFMPPKAPVRSVVEKVFGFEVATEAAKSNVYGLCPGDEGLSVSKDGGSIDAITAATISSRAFLDATNRAYSVFKQSLAAGGEQQ
ncbi:MAG: hypothetical protein CSA07_02295 [Bacteroidia bacterium]|nr:MAG: hypothetical protein CSA07_02295 [Bacteroidia bacterium]